MLPLDGRKRVGEIVSLLIQDVVGVSAEAIVPEAELVRDLGADSLEVIELEHRIEDAFTINVLSDNKTEQMITVADIINVLTIKIANGTARFPSDLAHLESGKRT